MYGLINKFFEEQLKAATKHVSLLSEQEVIFNEELERTVIR